MEGCKPQVTNPKNCKKLVSHFIQLSKQRFILCHTEVSFTLTVQCCNLVSLSGTRMKGSFFFRARNDYVTNLDVSVNQASDFDSNKDPA
jgi:hypothetical protein